LGFSVDVLHHFARVEANGRGFLDLYLSDPELYLTRPKFIKHDRLLVVSSDLLAVSSDAVTIGKVFIRTIASMPCAVMPVHDTKPVLGW
jgi:hypothetical protein